MNETEQRIRGLEERVATLEKRLEEMSEPPVFVAQSLDELVCKDFPASIVEGLTSVVSTADVTEAKE